MNLIRKCQENARIAHFKMALSKPSSSHLLPLTPPLLKKERNFKKR